MFVWQIFLNYVNKTYISTNNIWFHRRNDLILSKKHSNLPKNVQKIIDIVLGSLTIDALIILKP